MCSDEDTVEQRHALTDKRKSGQKVLCDRMYKI